MDTDSEIAAERARLALSRPDLLRDQALINGRWVGSPARLAVTNPATGQVLGDVPDLGSEWAEQAVAAAHVSGPDWRRRSGKERGGLLRRWFELVTANAEDLARLLTAEQGKPLAEARAEIAYAASYIEWFAEEAKRVYGHVIPGHRRDSRLVVLRQPVGVVAAVTPWNFPAAMITRKIAPALAVGCTAVLKPSELTPFSALALAALAQEAGLPPGVFNVVTGQAAPIGEVLTGDPRVRKFTFTGSTPVGKTLAARCMNTVKRVSLELGGNAPFIVFDDADLDAAVDGALAAKFRNTGQTCICANRFFVQAGVYDAFAARFIARVKTLVAGDGLAGHTDQGPLINEAAVEKVRAHVQDAVDHGGAVWSAAGCDRPGFYPPTVITEVSAACRVAREETFGPVAPLIRFETEAQVIAMANDTPAGLAAYLFTRDQSRSWRVSEALEYGMVGVNTALISAEVVPFGGMKESGFGREGSFLGVDDYLDVKSVCVGVA